MRSLKAEKRTYIFVYDHDLADFIKAVYGQEINLPATEEWTSQSGAEIISVAKDSKMTERDRERLDKFKADGSGMYILSTIMDNLRDRGFISPGNYLVRYDY